MLPNSKCKVCGGSLVSIGNNTYQCKFCKSTYTESAPAPTAGATPNVKGGTGAGGVNVFDKNIGGVLEIFCDFGDCQGAGSGLLIDKEGYAVTNAHVIAAEGNLCRDLVVRICDREYDARIIAIGDEYGGYGDGVDLALLKIEGLPSKATPLSFADFKTVKNGEQVFVIGNSLGDGTCITSGIVSDKNRILNGQRLLMTDCAINGGNSGGPIFNSAGEVIGVIVCSRIQSDGSATEGMNYAIPADTVEEFICGKHDAVKLVRNRSIYKPHRFASCPVCSNSVQIDADESCYCPSCGKKWEHTNVVKREVRKAKAPCPRCGSWNTDVENNIFYCNDCEFEGG